MFKIGDKVKLTHNYDKYDTKTTYEDWLVHENIEYDTIYIVKEIHSGFNGYIRLENKKGRADNYWLWAKYFGKPCGFVLNIEDF